MSSCMRIILVEYDIFPEIDNLMSKYLTSHILSAEYMKMAQCLYFIANKMQLDDLDLNLMDGFIEDFYDAKKVLLKSMIAEV
ncbi:20314_t:CDS:2, partial [Dentiscutata erythropus]